MTDNEKNEKMLYEKAFEFVASSGNEDPVALAAALGIDTEEADCIIDRMKERGDIASDDYASEDADSADGAWQDDYEIPIHVIEDALSFIGDVVVETGEKICDVLDESLEKVLSYDFGD